MRILKNTVLAKRKFRSLSTKESFKGGYAVKSRKKIKQLSSCSHMD